MRPGLGRAREAEDTDGAHCSDTQTGVVVGKSAFLGQRRRGRTGTGIAEPDQSQPAQLVGPLGEGEPGGQIARKGARRSTVEEGVEPRRRLQREKRAQRCHHEAKVRERRPGIIQDGHRSHAASVTATEP